MDARLVLAGVAMLTAVACKVETASVAPAPLACPEPAPLAASAPAPAEPQTPAPEPSAPTPDKDEDESEYEDRVDLPWGFIERQDLRPHDVDGVFATVSAVAGDETEEPSLDMRVQVADAQGHLAVFRERMDDLDCGGTFTTSARFVGHLDGVVLEVRLECTVGVESHRWRTGHMFVLVDDEARTAALLYAGSSGAHEKIDVYASGSFLRASIEGSTLAIYEETESWCDAKAWRAMSDERNPKCRFRPRTLKLKKRIPSP